MNGEELKREIRDAYYNDDMYSRYDLVDAVEDIVDENAKLRELVKSMFDRVNYECRCCSIFCSDWDEENECCVFATSMRELGIEV